MPRYHHHICLVSTQNVAELLGVLHPEIGAPHLHAIVTSKMSQASESLKKACQKAGIKFSAYKLEKIEISEIQKLLDTIWYNDPEALWAVNITGGTKIMSLSAYMWAQQNGIPAFYVDTENRNILVYDKNAWNIITIPPILKFESLLNLYGCEVLKQIKEPVSAASRKIAESFIEMATNEKNFNAFKNLNGLAACAKESKNLKAPFKMWQPFSKVLALCKNSGKLDYSDTHVVFSDEASRKWCNGIWLEEYVQAILARLESEGRINSWASSVEILRKGVIKNELDAVFTANNRFYALECKTADMQSEKQTDIIYKVDSLKEKLGGILIKFMVCSLFPLQMPSVQRAKNISIKTVHGSDLKNLRKILIEWMDDNE